MPQKRISIATSCGVTSRRGITGGAKGEVAVGTEYALTLFMTRIYAPAAVAGTGKIRMGHEGNLRDRYAQRDLAGRWNCWRATPSGSPATRAFRPRHCAAFAREGHQAVAEEGVVHLVSTASTSPG